MNDEPLPTEYCPLCEPDVDPMSYVVPGPCNLHNAPWDGYTFPYSPEVGGEDNRQWCDLIHRGILPGGPSLVDPHF